MKEIAGIGLGILILGASPLCGQTTEKTLLAQAGTSGSGGTSADPCAQGTMDAEMAGTGMWTVAGLGGGFLLGCIGCGGVWFLASSSDPQPPLYKMANMSPQDQLIYTGCYQTRAKQKASSAALMGGVVGTLASVALYFLLFMPAG